jgi:hypothetical protein
MMPSRGPDGRLVGVDGRLDALQERSTAGAWHGPGVGLVAGDLPPDGCVQLADAIVQGALLTARGSGRMELA